MATVMPSGDGKDMTTLRRRREGCDLGAGRLMESLLFPRSQIIAAAGTSDIAALDVPY